LFDEKIISENSFVYSLLKIIKNKNSIFDNKNLNEFNNQILTNLTPLKDQDNYLNELKKRLIGLIDSFNIEIFENQTDKQILNNLIEWDNQFLILTFESFVENSNIENFINSIKILIKNYKEKNNKTLNINETSLIEHNRNSKFSKITNKNDNVNTVNLDLRRFKSSKSKILNEQMINLQYSPVFSSLSKIDFNNNLENKKWESNTINKNLNNNNIQIKNKDIKTPKGKTNLINRHISQNFTVINNHNKNLFLESTRSSSKIGTINSQFNKNIIDISKPNFNQEILFIKNKEEKKAEKENKLIDLIQYIENNNDYDKNIIYESTITGNNNKNKSFKVDDSDEDLYMKTIQYPDLSSESYDKKENNLLKNTMTDDFYQTEKEKQFVKDRINRNNFICEVTIDDYKNKENFTIETHQSTRKNLNDIQIKQFIDNSFINYPTNNYNKDATRILNSENFKKIEFQNYMRSFFLKTKEDKKLIKIIKNDNIYKSLIMAYISNRNTSELENSIKILLDKYKKNLKLKGKTNFVNLQEKKISKNREEKKFSVSSNNQNKSNNKNTKNINLNMKKNQKKSCLNINNKESFQEKKIVLDNNYICNTLLLNGNSNSGSKYISFFNNSSKNFSSSSIIKFNEMDNNTNSYLYSNKKLNKILNNQISFSNNCIDFFTETGNKSKKIL